MFMLINLLYWGNRVEFNSVALVAGCKGWAYPEMLKGKGTSTPGLKRKNPPKSVRNLAEGSRYQGVESRRWPVRDYNSCKSENNTCPP